MGCRPWGPRGHTGQPPSQLWTGRGRRRDSGRAPGLPAAAFAGSSTPSLPPFPPRRTWELPEEVCLLERQMTERGERQRSPICRSAPHVAARLSQEPGRRLGLPYQRQSGQDSDRHPNQWRHTPPSRGDAPPPPQESTELCLLCWELEQRCCSLESLLPRRLGRWTYSRPQGSIPAHPCSSAMEQAPYSPRAAGEETEAWGRGQDDRPG